MATNMEMSLSYPASKFESDNSLTNPAVLEKYQLAADIVNGKQKLSFFLCFSRSTWTNFYFLDSCSPCCC